VIYEDQVPSQAGEPHAELTSVPFRLPRRARRVPCRRVPGGHAVGDQALQAVAAALSGLARRDGDGVARLGGDEFVVLPRAGRTRVLEAADEIRSPARARCRAAGPG